MSGQVSHGDSRARRCPHRTVLGIFSRTSRPARTVVLGGAIDVGSGIYGVFKAIIGHAKGEYVAPVAADLR